MSVALVAKILAEHDVHFALFGGAAVIAHGVLRSTKDYDFVTTNSAILDRAVWSAVGELGTVDVRRGEFDDPLRGVVRIRFASSDPVDVVVAKYRWQQAIIDRAEPMDVGQLTIPVARIPDLILLKVFAGGPLDVSDIHALLERADNRQQIILEVDAHIADLPDDAQKLWATLRAE